MRGQEVWMVCRGRAMCVLLRAHVWYGQGIFSYRWIGRVWHVGHFASFAVGEFPSFLGFAPLMIVRDDGGHVLGVAGETLDAHQRRLRSIVLQAMENDGNSIGVRLGWNSTAQQA